MPRHTSWTASYRYFLKKSIEFFLGVCPKLHEKVNMVNIRTFVQFMMNRLTNYYADASLLEGKNTYGVKV